MCIAQSDNTDVMTPTDIGHGTVNITDATVNTRDIMMGYIGGVGTLNVKGNAHLNAANITQGFNFGGWTVPSQGVGNVNVYDNSTVNVAGTITDGGCGGIGTWTQYGGTTTATAGVALGQADFWDSIAGTATLNLKGGVFATPFISNYSIPGNTLVPTGVVEFDGGTLMASGSGTNAGFIVPGAFNIPSSTDTRGSISLLVMAGGAKIDTNGFHIVIGRQFAPGVVGDGGLTKLGAGTLTLSTNNAYTGPTNVNAGTLALNTTNAVNPASQFIINGGQ
jgi:autotransporter-associated beta strand protein